MEAFFQAKGHKMPLIRPYIMGILNVTPDSFSDGGSYFSPQKAVERAKQMEEEGADILDIGGQSTRPGYTEISPEEEWERIEEVLALVLQNTKLPVSVDTFYPQVAKKALEAGAHIINDVKGFPDEMFKAAADSGCGCIVMHPRGSMGGEILTEVRAFFEERKEAALRFGIVPSRLCFDPGIGFGKTYGENLRLIARVEETKLEGSAYLMAASRKRVTGTPCGDPPFSERLPATLAAHTAAILGGAQLLRVHDVKEGVQAAKMAWALKTQGSVPEI